MLAPHINIIIINAIPTLSALRALEVARLALKSRLQLISGREVKVTMAIVDGI
jgi:hypothetical protein